MADKPILFSAAMVRALLAGTKTQTRRVLKPQPFIDANGNFCVPRRKGGHWIYGQHIDGSPCVRNFAEGLRIKVGDRLWVRENWYGPHSADDVKPRDMDATWKVCPAADWNYADWGIKGRLRPGIHMPRWASRLTLTVTEVRVQRLQDISEDDARAEGIVLVGTYPMADGIASDPLVGYSAEEAWSHDPRDPRPIYELPGSARAAYRQLWNQINDFGSWEENPWVAAYTFTVERGNIDCLGRAA